MWRPFDRIKERLPELRSTLLRVRDQADLLRHVASKVRAPGIGGQSSLTSMDLGDARATFELLGLYAATSGGSLSIFYAVLFARLHLSPLESSLAPATLAAGAVALSILPLGFGWITLVILQAFKVRFDLTFHAIDIAFTFGCLALTAEVLAGVRSQPGGWLAALALLPIGLAGMAIVAAFSYAATNNRTEHMTDESMKATLRSLPSQRWVSYAAAVAACLMQFYIVATRLPVVFNTSPLAGYSVRVFPGISLVDFRAEVVTPLSSQTSAELASLFPLGSDTRNDAQPVSDLRNPPVVNRYCLVLIDSSGTEYQFLAATDGGAGADAVVTLDISSISMVSPTTSAFSQQLARNCVDF